jgi:hypothetical protein
MQTGPAKSGAVTPLAGEAEWLIAAVLKTVGGVSASPVGSNPTPSTYHIPQVSAILVTEAKWRPCVRATAIAFGVVLAVQGSAHAACGDRGGPGYRGPDHQCLKWYSLVKGVCGCPPTTNCTAEHLHAGAEKIAKLRCKL